MTSSLPAAARLAWWATSWLRGQVVTDLLIDAVIGDDATHAVAGLPGSEGTETLLGGLAALRGLGASQVGAAFPSEGDPVGVGGPRAFAADAIEVGEAVVVAGTGLGLVPWRTGRAITWTAQPADRRQLADVGEADRALRATLLEAAGTLARLDVAAWSPDVADRLIDLDRGEPLDAPPGTPARCVDLAARAVFAIDVAALALESDGGALTAYDVQRRRDAVLPLDRAGRRALTAACSPEVWPPS